MARLICLQSGHEGRTSGSTGAPGEIELNVRIRNRLSQILIDKGFQLQLVNADPPQVDITKDFDLFLALHGDANIYGTGGGVVACIAPPPFDSSEESNAESRRIRDAIKSEYFDHSGIVEHPERSNANMTEYYMWNRLSAKTPCVIIEMGVVQDAHDKVLLADTERIATALARGVCRAFNVVYDPVIQPEPTQPTPEPTTTPNTTTTPLPDLSGEVIALENKLKTIHDVVWGKGWIWVRMNQLKGLLPK
jgi:N-acetylmuramoyl-L-alanine amidase